MSLRYRLFLWVVLLFVLSAVVSTFIKSIVTNRTLKKAEENLCQKVLNATDDLSFQVKLTLLQSLEEGAQNVSRSIYTHVLISNGFILILAIVCLNYFLKNITAPLRQLAAATRDIKEGKWQSVEKILPAPKGKDEVALLCHAFEEMVKGLQEKEKVKSILNKVVSVDIAQEILSGQVRLGGEEKIVTVLFADIRHFTEMTQTLLPHEIIDLLNNCMTKISSCIDHHRGVIDKYVGDEVMALFGAPVYKEDSALCAVKSALEMVDVLNRWNAMRREKALTAVEIGIGIHTGEMLVGNMGAENRLNYTVIGSNVNLASRICSVAKGMEILISAQTLEQPGVKEAVRYEKTEPISLKGFKDPVVLYRII